MDEYQKYCAEQKMPHTHPKVKTLLFYSYEILKKRKYLWWQKSESDFQGREQEEE